jgi:hypothetical protein
MTERAVNKNDNCDSQWLAWSHRLPSPFMLAITATVCSGIVLQSNSAYAASSNSSNPVAALELRTTSSTAATSAGATRNSEDEITRLRPSYRSIYEPCMANRAKFESDMMNQAYMGGLTYVLKLPTEEGIKDTLHGRGLSNFMEEFLSSETTAPALLACYGNDDKHHLFIRNLMATEFSGKTAGTLLLLGSGKMVGAAFKGIFSGLSKISIRLAKSAMIATAAISTAWTLKILREKYHEENQPVDPEAEQKAQVEAQNFSTDYDLGMVTEAQKNLSQINKLLKEPKLTHEDRKSLEREKKNWTIIFNSFSAGNNQ